MKKDFINNPKGMSDSDAANQLMRNRIIDVLKKNFEGYGYFPLETAIVNNLSLLTYKYESNAEIVNEIYKIKDQGERDLGLRFDLTVPFCKFIASNPNMKMPFKRYEIGKVWRNGPVKSGRAREFYQCDIDCVGLNGALIEAEMISMAVKTYLELGITPQIMYGNRKLLPYTDAVIAIIDKLAKMPLPEIIAELKKHMTEAQAVELVKNIKSAEKIPEILELEKYLTELGVIKYCSYAPWLARGLNVYTGTVWEVFAKGSQMQSSMGGGGRYDRIIGNFIENGKEYPAVGMSFGLEPITAVIKENLEWAQPMGAGVTPAANDTLMLIPLGTEVQAQIYADKLRAQGKKVLVYLGNKNLAKAFEYAASYGIKYCAVYGSDEVAGKEPVIKQVN
jgi:histidyl-tRNA synthetase